MANPLAEFYAPIQAAAERLRRKSEDPALEPLPWEEPCFAVSPPKADGEGNLACYLLDGHKGPHSWEIE